MKANFKCNIKYVLPEFLNSYINESLIKIYEEYDYITRDHTYIYTFYGSFPHSLWNGGRLVEKEMPKLSKKAIVKLRNYYNKRGIIITLTFTNPLIEKEHLSDEYCNMILDVLDNGMNEVLVSSDTLEFYIRKTHPNFKVNRSILAAEDKPFDLDDKYNITVLDKRKNNDFKFLNSIPHDKRYKVEILCNDTCIDNCKYYYKHYIEIAQIQLGLRKAGNPETDQFPYGFCKHMNINDEDSMFAYYYYLYKSKINISPEQIYEKYLPMGFQYFKLAGREMFITYRLESIVQYCIKEEYQEDVRIYMAEKMIMEYKRYFRKYILNH